MKKVEFHVHTKASKDSILSKCFILLMCKIKKIDCLAITDHNEIWYAKKIKPFFNKRGIEIIVGEEIFTKDGEIIGLFLNEKIKENLSAEDTVKEIKKQHGLVYIPHPYDIKRNKTVLKKQVLDRICKDVDFIEMHNGRNVSEVYTRMQTKIADEVKATKIVGSDAHTFYELGRNFCYVDSFEKNDIVSEIEKGKFNQKKCLNIAHTNTKFVKSMKMLRKGDINGIIRIIRKKIRRGK